MAPDQITHPPLSAEALGHLPVSFLLPSQAVFPASFVDIPVRVDRRRVHPKDVLFAVVRRDDPRDRTCLISLSRNSKARSTTIRLLAGPRLGAYALTATHKQTGRLLGGTPFHIDPTGPHADIGPSFWSRPTDGPPGVAVGGGPPGVANVGAVRNLRGQKWRVVVALLDFDDSAFPAGAAAQKAARKRWKGMLTDGSPFASGSASVASYYDEDSFGQLAITGDVVGPIAVTGTFLSYFPERTDATKGMFHLPQGAIEPPPPGETFYEAVDPHDWQALASAVEGSIDLSQYDSVVFVPKNYTPADKSFERFVWPQATVGQATIKIPVTQPDGTVVSGDHPIGCLAMPDNFDFVKPTMTTICHELGHNFGLTDLYTPAVQGDSPKQPRNLGGWDPMSAEGGLPHHCLAHKLWVGWIVDPAVTDIATRDAIVRSLDFSVSNQGEQTVDIAPLEEALIAPFRHGLEIRIAAGRNYYFEYRNATAATIGDQFLPETPIVLGTDALPDTTGEAAARPEILLLSGDPDKDSAVLSLGEDFNRNNLLSGDAPMTLRVEVVDIQSTHAAVKVSFAVPARPNPAITPWNTDPTRWWQSPDIEVRNDKTDADPATYANKMWLGHPNRLIARVTNKGGVDAPGVTVAFSLKDYTVGGTPESDPIFDTHDVPAGATVEFQGLVVPQAKVDAHYCVIVRIQPYQLPVSKELEDNVYDNVAQSNYTGLTSIIASPPTRASLKVAVGNPFTRPTRVHIEPEQSHGGFIGYLGQRWLRLAGGQTALVDVATEYAPAPASLMSKSDYMERLPFRLEAGHGMHGRAALSSYVENPDDKHPRRLAGADIDLRAAFHTRFKAVRKGPLRITGIVVRSIAGRQDLPVTGGWVLLTPTDGTARPTLSTKADAGGRFHFAGTAGAKLPPSFLLSYLGHQLDGPCEVTGSIS